MSVPLSTPSFSRVAALPPRELRLRPLGFSLIEVVMAIGIISFAFVAIFGLLPSGLSVFRKAMDTSVGSQIVQRIMNEAQQTDFDTLAALGTVTRYFDEQGNELQGNTGSIYSVEMKVTTPTTLPSSSPTSPESLATVTIKIANDPGHRGSVFGDPAKYTAYSALVARTAGKLSSN